MRNEYQNVASKFCNKSNVNDQFSKNGVFFSQKIAVIERDN